MKVPPFNQLHLCYTHRGKMAQPPFFTGLLGLASNPLAHGTFLRGGNAKGGVFAFFDHFPLRQICLAALEFLLGIKYN